MNKKMTTEELDELRLIQEEYNKKIFEFGQLATSKILIEREIKELTKLQTQLEEDYFKIQEKEKLIAEKLEKIYGTGKIDLDLGEFISD